MKGSSRRRSKDSWELTIDLGRDAQGKRLRKFMNVRGTKSTADRRLREVLSRLDKGIPLAQEKVTVSSWLDRWMADHVVVNGRQKTVERYQGIIDRHVRPRLGHLQLTKIAPADIQKLESELLTQGMAPAGVELVHTVTSGALKYALRMEMVWRNPAQAVSPLKRPHAEPPTPEIEYVRRVLLRGRRDQHPLHAALHLVAYTGIRRGEAMGLMWSEVDLESGWIIVSRGLVRTNTQGLVLENTKTDGSRRKIDLDSETAAVLRAHKVNQLEHRLKADGAYEDRELVFLDSLGQLRNPMALTRAFQSLALKEGLPKLKLHSLRHFHASVLFEQGESPLLVSRRLGHASIKTTVDIYGHLFEGAQKQAAQRFAERMKGTN